MVFKNKFKNICFSLMHLRYITYQLKLNKLCIYLLVSTFIVLFMVYILNPLSSMDCEQMEAGSCKLDLLNY